MIAPFDTSASCGNKTKEVADPPDHLVVAGLSVEAPRELPDVVRRQLRPGVRREDVEKAVLRWSQPDGPAIDADLLVDAQLQRMDEYAMARLTDDGESAKERERTHRERIAWERDGGDLIRSSTKIQD